LSYLANTQTNKQSLAKTYLLGVGNYFGFSLVVELRTFLVASAAANLIN